MGDEVDVGDPGQRADEHVLRVTGDGGHAANIRRGRDRDDVRDQGKTKTLSQMHDEGRHD